ncbi:MAG: hypothetical protein AAF253_07350 [Pseudomonadota bacterium]
MSKTATKCLILFFSLSIATVHVDAQESAYVELCNNGDVKIHAGFLIETVQDKYNLVSPGHILEPNDCSYISRDGWDKSVFFLVEDPENGAVYNPIFNQSDIVAKNPAAHVSKVCVPRHFDGVVKTVSHKIVEKFQSQCPRNWVQVTTSFTIVSVGRSQLTLKISPELKSMYRRAW